MIGLFGQTVIPPMKCEQIPLFHEPVEFEPNELPGTTAADEKIARKFRDTKTAEMFTDPARA